MDTIDLHTYDEQTKFNDTLTACLQGGPVRVTFTKKNGEARDMLCTQNAEYLPEQEIKEGKTPREKNPNLVVVWDLEKEAFRSFNFDQVEFFIVVKE